MVFVGGDPRQMAYAVRRAVEMIPRESNLLLDVFGLENLIEVLHADRAVQVVGRVVGPALGFDGPASPVVFTVHPFVDAEPADENDLAADLAEGGDCRVCVPSPCFVAVCVVVKENSPELLIGHVTGALSFQGDDQGLRGLLGEEAVYFVQQLPEVLWSSQGDGENTVNQRKPITLRGLRLHPQIEEAHTILELFPWADGLASYRGKGAVACRRIVGPWYRKRREWRGVLQMLHPAVQVGRAIQREVCFPGKEYASELESGILVQWDQGLGRILGGRSVDPVPLPSCFEREP